MKQHDNDISRPRKSNHVMHPNWICSCSQRRQRCAHQHIAFHMWQAPAQESIAYHVSFVHVSTLVPPSPWWGGKALFVQEADNYRLHDERTLTLSGVTGRHFSHVRKKRPGEFLKARKIITRQIKAALGPPLGLWERCSVIFSISFLTWRLS